MQINRGQLVAGATINLEYTPILYFTKNEDCGANSIDDLIKELKIRRAWSGRKYYLNIADGYKRVRSSWEYRSILNQNNGKTIKVFSLEEVKRKLSQYTQNTKIINLLVYNSALEFKSLASLNECLKELEELIPSLQSILQNNKCSVCGKQIYDNIVCSDCQNNSKKTVVCNCCGAITNNPNSFKIGLNGSILCPSCFKEHYFECPVCHNISEHGTVCKCGNKKKILYTSTVDMLISEDWLSSNNENKYNLFTTESIPKDLLYDLSQTDDLYVATSGQVYAKLCKSVDELDDKIEKIFNDIGKANECNVAYRLYSDVKLSSVVVYILDKLATYLSTLTQTDCRSVISSQFTEYISYSRSNMKVLNNFYDGSISKHILTEKICEFIAQRGYIGASGINFRKTDGGAYMYYFTSKNYENAKVILQLLNELLELSKTMIFEQLENFNVDDLITSIINKYTRV